MLLIEGGDRLQINIDRDICHGCRICELVCSFHHAKVFSPEISSISVSKNKQTAEVEWSIDSSCDLCKGEPHPLCIEFCLYGAVKEVQ